MKKFAVVPTNKAQVFDSAAEAGEAITSHDSASIEFYQYEVRFVQNETGYMVTVIDVEDKRVGCLKVVEFDLTVKGEEALQFDTAEQAIDAFNRSGFNRDNIGMTYDGIFKRARIVGPLGSWLGDLCEAKEEG